MSKAKSRSKETAAAPAAEEAFLQDEAIANEEAVVGGADDTITTIEKLQEFGVNAGSEMESLF